MTTRILLVNNDTHASAATKRLLNDAGYLVTTLASFEEATRHLERERPDILVTSLRLGQFNGVHLALRARIEHPDLPVFVTGSAEDEAGGAEAVDHGARFVSVTAGADKLLTIIGETTVAAGPGALRVVAQPPPVLRSRVSDSDLRQIIRDVQDAPQSTAPVSPALGRTTFHRMKARIGWTSVEDIRRLRHLEDENRKLKQIVADQALDIEALKAAIGKP